LLSFELIFDFFHEIFGNEKWYISDREWITV
jgi:hypothetical protein